MELSKQQVSELKQELIEAYKAEGFKNCIGSVEKIVEELFELRRKDKIKKDWKYSSFNSTMRK